jgi:hypothetical protein
VVKERTALSEPDNGLFRLVPRTDADYAAVREYLSEHAALWRSRLDAGSAELSTHLSAAGLQVFGPRATYSDVTADSVLIQTRVKTPEAIVAKMRRFGEPLRVILDRWGYRVVVSDETALDEVAGLCAGVWTTPSPADLLLRNGELQFDARRDYRRRDHAGLSAATTNNYDQAVHLNRKTNFGIVEVQIMTTDLYRRVHGNPAGADSHETYVARREQALWERGQ